MSVIALLEIAVAAKHLAVIGGRRAAFAPGHDMIGMHFRELKMLPAIRTDSALPFIGRTLHAVVERSDGETTFLAGEQILVDAGFLGHILVCHEA